MNESRGRAPTPAFGVLLAVGLQVAAAIAQPPPRRPLIVGIDHVAFRVSDAAAARAFYQDVLGLPEAAARRDRLTFQVGAHQDLRLEPGLPAGEDERLRHLAFATPDVAALRTYLAGRGVQVTQPTDRCDAPAIQVIDPDGHTIEFVQRTWPPGAARVGSDHAVSARLLHAGLIVRDEAAADAFYRDILGFAEIWRGGRQPGVISWVNMRVPDGTDYLEYMLESRSPDRRQRGVLHHACLRVTDIQVAWELVAARSADAGRALPSPPSVGTNGPWLMNLYDPDGTRVELMEPFTMR